MRLAKYLARAGVASRRHCERLVAAGRVEVDGLQVTDPAHPVDESSDVRVDGRPVQPEPLVHFAVNKPVGVVSTAHDPQGRPKVVDLVPSKARLYPVGRLDFDSSGLILLTNDGALANHLMHPRYEVEKTYRASVEGRIGEDALRRLRTGVELEDGTTAPASARVVEQGPAQTVIELTLREGRKRQIRRMCAAVGHPVIALERTRIGDVTLEGLGAGDSRPLSREEVESLRAAAAAKGG